MNPPANEGDIRDTHLIPGSGRFHAGGDGSPLQYSCLENSMDRGALWATVNGVPKSQTQLSYWTCMHLQGHFRSNLNKQIWINQNMTISFRLNYKEVILGFSSIQSLSRVRLFATPWIAARQASLSITNSQSSLKLTSIESVMPSSHLILCRPLLLLPPIPPSIRVFSNESTLHMRWPKYWSFSFSISLSNEHPGLISSRMDWLDLLAVQGALNSLLQDHNSKASILWWSAFLTVQLSHPYVMTRKTIALTR